MPLTFPEDRNCDDMTYQYMFGPWYCVGIFTNEIYLPKGTWTDAWTGERIRSRGEFVKRPYPEDRAGLLFIRGGAILPCAEVIRVYPCGDSSYTQYDCDPESYGYEDGLVAATRMDCSQSGKAVRIVVHPVEGTYETLPSARNLTFRVACEKRPSKVTANGVPMKDWTWQDGFATIPAGERPLAETLEIDIK